MGAERNYARFYCLLKRLPGADKETLVEQFTNGRTVHLHETTEREYRIMCDQMERVAGYDERKAAWREEIRKKRSLCLKLMQRLGVNTTDWPTVDNFCQNPRVGGKPFARLSIEELDALQRKLRAIERHGGLNKKTSSNPASPNPLLSLASRTATFGSEGRETSQGKGAFIVFPMYNIKEN